MGNDNSVNQQNQQNQQNIVYDSLEQHYKDAIDMRIKGYKYEYISAFLTRSGHKVSEQWVREWFMQGGKCYDAYLFKKTLIREEAKKEFAEVEEQIKEGAVDAIQTLKNSSKSSWKAALELLKLAGFVPVTKFQDVGEGSEAYKLVKKLLHENEGIIKNNGSSNNLQDKQ